ncbi:hypothetical protein JCM1840_000321 [Sporobolomyces johnsonii]
MPTSICVVGGAGLIGKRHVAHCLDEPTVDLSCIVDPTPAGAAFASQHKLVLYKSVDEMLIARKARLVNVDGVILATPNVTHVPLGIQLLEAGITTLVEKPLATDVDSGRALVAAEQGSTAKILNPYSVNAKKLLESGSLGQILAIQGQWTTLKPLNYFETPTEWRKVPGTGGVVLINLVHDVDLLRHFFGDIVRVYCETGPSTRGHSVEETGACTLKFASGVVGTFVFSDAVASPYNFESATGENPLMPKLGQPIYTAMGTKGSFSVPDLKLFHYSSPSHSWTDSLVVDESQPIDPTPPFTHQLRHFARVVEGKDEPRCGALDALGTIITLEAILESMRTGKPVDVAHG